MEHDDMLPVAQIGPPLADGSARKTAEALTTAIRSYQRLLTIVEEVTPPDIQEQRNQARADLLEEIFHLIEENLRRLARRYYRSERVCQEIRSSAAHYDEDLLKVIAFDMFYYVIEELPKLEPDPTKNVIGLLITAADRRWKNDRIYRSPSSTTLIPLDIADNEAALADESAMSPVDDRLQHQSLRQLLMAFRSKCDAIDRWVLDGRLAAPPISFADLAQRLGSGHSADMLRQRWHRMRKRLTPYLKQHDAL